MLSLCGKRGEEEARAAYCYAMGQMIKGDKSQEETATGDAIVQQQATGLGSEGEQEAKRFT